MPGLKDQIGSIASNLMNLEINTIIKPNITSRKMSSPAHTLIDIAKKFNFKLTAFGYPCEEETFKPGSFSSFNCIREKANTGIQNLEKKSKKSGLSQQEEADLIMLWRIKTMSDQIKGILNRLNCKQEFSREDIEKGKVTLKMNGDELVQIRKIWEIGTEVVALQTIIQMDGDVITRVNPAYAGQAHKNLQRLHGQGIRTSVDFWQDLVHIVTNFLESLLKRIL